MIRYFKYLLLLSVVAQMASCVSAKKAKKEMVYFQRDTTNLAAIVYKPTTIQSNDLLQIIVAAQSLNQEQASIFNILANGGTSSASSQGQGGGAATGSSGGGSSSMNGYLVDFDGNINIPFVGKIRAAGLTKDALQTLLQDTLRRYVQDPIVLVRYLNYKVNVFGEVKAPGTRYFTNEKVNVLDALAASGDLTDRAIRNDIVIIRQEDNGAPTMHHLDLTSAAIYHDPYFQLHQNDVIYVAPTKNGLKGMNINPTIYRDIPIALSIITLVTTTVVIFSK